MMTLKRSRVGVIIALAMIPALAGCGVNAIPTKEERARAAWGDVQSQYQRRADLVPNLVATVQASAVQERTVLNEVIEARARATSVNVSPDDAAAMQAFQASQSELAGALSRLLMVVEAYPELQSNRNFLELQSQLEGAENRIAIARRDYNEAVRDYNTELRTFPGVVWASTLHGGSEPMQPFEATEAAQTAPEVNFNLDAPPAAASQTAPGR
ncbi:MAG: LemA family protein [Brevundimonas sp.]|uniref:LemA family protein n=1 Tax=Brevundimonas sp. TaxID=1871086 RepID=UPI00391D67E8